jgi:two-component system alkaline phosphatase synthesis response regulator PhoP
MSKILIIEDEPSILMALEDSLTLEGHTVTGETHGARGFERASAGGYDLILLDIMLPGMDGFDICRKLRGAGDRTPILMLTAKGQEVDKVLGLELGADDYVTKPFSRREVLARVKALLRRAEPVELPLESFRFADVTVDFSGYEVRKDGQPVELTPTEFALLKLLIARQGQAVRRDVMLDEIWGDDSDVFLRTVDTHIAHLRQKLEAQLAHPRHIVNVRGVGYKFVADPA